MQSEDVHYLIPVDRVLAVALEVFRLNILELLLHDVEIFKEALFLGLVLAGDVGARQ